MRSRVCRAFTLVELLVVMAVSVILLGLVFGPLIQGFDLLRAARVQVQAYDTARTLMERLQGDLAEGAYVFDHGGSVVNLWVESAPGVTSAVSLPFALVDLVPPARQGDQATYDPENTDPTTGLPIERGPVVLPVSPGRVIVRYFLGLRDNTTTGGDAGQPVKPYKNWLEDRKRVLPADDNRTILYRAVVSPYLPSGEVDTRLFRVKDGKPVLYDPNFFYDDTVPEKPNAETDALYPGARVTHADGKVRYSDNWRAVARPIVPIERADMVRAERNDDGTVDYTRLEPLIRFQPTQVVGDVAAPQSIGDPGNEAPDAPATTFFGTYGFWNTPVNVYVYRSGLDASPLDYFFWDGVNTVRHRTAQFSNGTWSVTTDVDTQYNPATASGANPQLAFRVDPVRGVVDFGLDDMSLLANQPSQFLASGINATFAAGHRIASLLDLTYPLPRVSPLASIPNARIVPGSEVVRGPDMRPGPNYGNVITYTRVPRRNDPMLLGPNEYMINYTDLAATPPGLPLDPLLRKGTILFNSRENSAGVVNALPAQDGAGNPAVVTVRYRLQNNLSTDVVKVDYLTRQLMTFALGVRLYDTATGNAQQVNLSEKVQVRNLQR